MSTPSQPRPPAPISPTVLSAVPAIAVPAIAVPTLHDQQRWTAAVRAGAQFLDTAYATAAPGHEWFSPSCAAPIDLAILNLEDFAHCILGQILHSRSPYLSAETWRHRSFGILHPHLPTDVLYHNGAWMTFLVAHGFYPHNLHDSCPEWGPYVTATWTLEIVRRRAAAPCGCPECDSGHTPHTLAHEGKP